MSEPVSLTALRKQLFELVDRVLETGVPIVVERRGRHVLIIPGERVGSKLAQLRRRQGIVGDPADLVDLKVAEWDEERNLRRST